MPASLLRRLVCTVIAFALVTLAAGCSEDDANEIVAGTGYELTAPEGSWRWR